MRTMALDYGDARTGAAVSDAMNIMTGDAFVIPSWNEEKLIAAVKAEAQARDVSVLVVGRPLNMDGTAGERAEKCEALAQKLREATGLQVVMWDERHTTVDAHRILRENGRRTKDHRKNVDAVAASLILEGYLASVKSE